MRAAQTIIRSKLAPAVQVGPARTAPLALTPGGFEDLPLLTLVKVA
jgi:hypothetical protein